MKLRTALVCLAAVALAAATPRAQATPPQAPPQVPPGMSTQTPTIQQQNEQILLELRAIRQLLERLTTPSAPPRPTTARISNLKGYSLGSADAPLTMVEFTDLQCPFCRQFVLTSFDQIKANWIDTGKLRYISRDFPLDIHAQAIPAARAARCAGEQGKFWEMRMALMRNANLLTADYINKTASGLKLDSKPFAACTASSKYEAEITAEVQEGMALGVDGTPTFVIGRSTPNGIDGPVLVGALPYAQFDAKLKTLLASGTK